MSLRENKAIVKRYWEVINRRELDTLEEIVAPECVISDPARPARFPTGPEGVKQYAGMYIAAFPDLEFTVEEVLAEEDRVVACWRARGTHRGDLMGIAPTGVEIDVTGITVARIAGGKIVEERQNWDTLSLLLQLGALPS
jgi:steroid delta-isomerase-like uncharacterized protein